MNIQYVSGGKKVSQCVFVSSSLSVMNRAGEAGGLIYIGDAYMAACVCVTMRLVLGLNRICQCHVMMIV